MPLFSGNGKADQAKILSLGIDAPPPSKPKGGSMANGNGNGGSGLRFSSEISLGSLLQFILLLGAIFAAWNTFNQRLTIVEDKINVMGEIDARTKRIDSYLLHKDPDYYRTADGDKR